MAKPRALRLTFTYKDGAVHLASRQEVDMTLPPTDPPPKDGEAGFWADLQDASGRSVFRRVMLNPIPADLEVFSDAKERNLSRVPGGPTEGMFSIVVPNHPDATTLAMLSSFHEPAPPPAGHVAGLALRHVHAVTGRPHASREIARFDVRKA